MMAMPSPFSGTGSARMQIEAGLIETAHLGEKRGRGFAQIAGRAEDFDVLEIMSVGSCRHASSPIFRAELSPFARTSSGSGVKTQRRARRVVALELAGRFDRFAAGSLRSAALRGTRPFPTPAGGAAGVDAELRPNLRQILRRDRSRAQQSQTFRRPPPRSSIRAVLGRAAIDDERDAPAEFALHMRRGRRADAAEAIRARRGERFAESARAPRGRPDARSSAPRRSSSPAVTRSGTIVAARQHERERAGPESRDQRLDERAALAPGSSRMPFEPVAIRQMDDERIEKWPLLRLENLRHGIRSQRIGGEPVDRLRRQRDGFARGERSSHREPR